ncbi:MAG: hypothetical protein AB1711_03495 [Thermodesulfobacteriota bacterium]
MKDLRAQEILIKRYLDWGKVKERLLRYKYIGSQYKINWLQHCSKKGPYFCHYLAWRLGTWEDESWFEFFDGLLANGVSISNWNSNKNLLKSCNFDEFWGLVWQLQVAKFFSDEEGLNIKWMRSGPDLEVVTEKGPFYVECYTYRKSFGIEEFIKELLGHIDPRIRVGHTSCIKFSLPKNSDTEGFLDDVFRPYLDTEFLQREIRQAQLEYPVLLPRPNGAENLLIYIEGDNPNNYVPGRLGSGMGDPEKYLKHAIKEALGNKRYSNRLQNHHPNLLAVNFLLGEDLQSALHRQIRLNREVPVPDLDSTFDGVFLTACGIDEALSIDKMHLKIKQKDHQDHPIFDIEGIKEAARRVFC